MHPGAKEFAHSYLYFTIEPESFVFSFLGRIHTFTSTDFFEIEADPLAVHNRQLLNTFQSAEMESKVLVFAENYSGLKLQDCFMYFIDSLGVSILARIKKSPVSPSSAPQWTDIRLPFPQRFESPKLCRSALIESIEHAVSERVIQPI